MQQNFYFFLKMGCFFVWGKEKGDGMWCGVVFVAREKVLARGRTRDVWDVLCFFFLIDGFYSMWTGLTGSTTVWAVEFTGLQCRLYCSK
jgi:hypothetical protein